MANAVRDSKRTRLLWWGVAIALLVMTGVILVTSFQRELMYFPDDSPAGHVGGLIDGAEDVVLRTDDGLELGAWLLAPAGTDRKSAVIYFPGNGGNRTSRLDVGREIAGRGFTVLLVDYRGYGGNPGSPTEEGLASDARAAVDLLRDRGFDAGSTLYVGESLGTGVAARLATTHPPAGVVLRSPFTSFVDVAKIHYPFLPVSTFLHDRYEAADQLAGIDVPVLVLHGDADSVVPSELSSRVAERAGNLFDDVVLPGVDHNDDVWFGPYLADQVVRLADAAAPAARSSQPGTAP